MEASSLETLRKEGGYHIRKFVKEVNSMTSYSLPQKHEDSRPEKSNENWFQKMKGSGYAEVFLRFSVWFVLILLLTSATVYLVSLRFILNSDTMATLIIGTSVGGAAALTAVLPRSVKSS